MRRKLKPQIRERTPKRRRQSVRGAVAAPGPVAVAVGVAVVAVFMAVTMPQPIS
jgi:hypothetical protein